MSSGRAVSNSHVLLIMSGLTFDFFGVRVRSTPAHTPAVAGIARARSSHALVTSHPMHKVDAMSRSTWSSDSHLHPSAPWHRTPRLEPRARRAVD